MYIYIYLTEIGDMAEKKDDQNSEKRAVLAINWKEPSVFSQSLPPREEREI